MKAVMLVTSRSSGASYLNCVELQNRCLALAHANFYIPCTLIGMPLNPETGNVDADLLSANLNKAADIYVQRVDKCPCGDTVINLYRRSKFEDMCTELQVKKKKEELRIKIQNLLPISLKFARLEKTITTRTYWQLIFSAVMQGCPHPRCKEGCPSEQLRWFPNGPNLMTCLLHPNRPFSDPNCRICHGVCSGHFLPLNRFLNLMGRQWYNLPLAY